MSVQSSGVMCKQCGEDHQGRCSAHLTKTGERCKRFAAKGAGVCSKHGGSARQVKDAAAVRVAEAEALAAYPRRSPQEIMLEALHKADARASVAEAEGRTDAEALRRQAAQFAQTAIDRGLVEWETKISEEQGKLLAGVIYRILDRLELSPAQKACVPVVVPAELRRIGQHLMGAKRWAESFEGVLEKQRAGQVVKAFTEAVASVSLGHEVRDDLVKEFVRLVREHESTVVREHESTAPVGGRGDR